ncbi:MAG: DUF4932 domain-containing protein [Cyclobacteriaceae bacterium]|nr:DUF4932 domain-containing protein [Cyclobacteriaceae bacterium]
MKPLLLLAFISLQNILFAQNTQSLFTRFNAKFKQANYAEAGATLDSLLAIEPKNNYWLFTNMELEAKKGNMSKANEWLYKLIKNGYCDIQELQTDDNLAELRNTPEFKSQMAELTAYLTKFKLNENEQLFTVDIPPLMECYTIMLYLGNPKHTLVNWMQHHSYFKKVDEYFGSYKNHGSVMELAKKYPSEETNFINNLRAHHNLKTFYVYDSIDISIVKRFPVELDFELAKLIQGFARETKFMQFYKSNAEFYDAMKTILHTNYSFGSKVIPFFNSNFDMKINRFNVYFSPIYGGWQHGPTARVGNYTECFYFGGIMYTNTKDFYYPDVNLLFTLLTEFDHTTVNDITSKYKTELKKLNNKLSSLNKDNGGGYNNIEATLNEYITWAFALQYFYENTPGEYAELEKSIVHSMEKNRLFVKFGDFMSFYKGSYILNRKKYPLLKDFYPEIISWVNRL